uniref:Uncharacterized protein n=1 Tax=Aegilops tauschii TaxID=37682 RepID=N1R4G7_AEGTA
MGGAPQEGEKRASRRTTPTHSPSRSTTSGSDALAARSTTSGSDALVTLITQPDHITVPACIAFVGGSQTAFSVRYGGGANELSSGFSKGTGLAAEIIGTFVLVYTVFSATDPKRSARDSHVPVLAPLPIGFAVFMVHLATIPITGTGINPARSFGAAVIYNNEKAWDDHWIFWVGPFIGAAIAAAYHQYVLRASATKLGSSASFGRN